MVRSSANNGPAQLGHDNVLRFHDVQHFLNEFAGNLGRGRAVVRTRRRHELQTSLAVHVEVPGIAWGVSLKALVVFVRDGLLGLEFQDFEATLPKLDMLAEEAEKSMASSEEDEEPAERTIIAPAPVRGASPPPLEDDADDSASFPLGAEGSGLGDEPSRDLPSRRALPREVTVATSAPMGFEVDEAPVPIDPRRAAPPPRRRVLPPARPQDTLAEEPPPRAAAGPQVVTRAPAPRSAEPPPRLGAAARLVERAPPHHQDSSDLGSSEDLAGDDTGDVNAHDRSGDLFDGHGSGSQDLGYASSSTSDDLGSSDSADLVREISSDLPDPSDDLRGGASRDLGSSDLGASSGQDLPPPEAPRIRAFGLEWLESKDVRLPRSTTSGVVRGVDPAMLLGLHLSALQHGFITLLGGPDGDEGERIKLKLAGSRIVTVEAEIKARVGDWVTLGIPDAAPIREALISEAPSVREALAQIFGQALSFADGTADVQKGGEPEAAPPTALPALPAPPSSASTLAPAEKRAEEAAEKKPSTQDLIPVPPTDDGPPRAPKLYGDLVVFDRAKDLRQEIDANIKNGGLFVESAPIPLQTKRSFRIVVAGKSTGVRVEATAVYLKGGCVGFMITSAAEIRAALERVLENRDAPPPGASAPSTPPAAPGPPTTGDIKIGSGDLRSSATGDIRLGTGDLKFPLAEVDQRVEVIALPPFTGRIAKVPSFGEILDLQLRRAKSASEVANSSLLFLFDYLIREGGRGTLALRSGEKRETIYIHDRSVAFIEAAPFDEETSLGRILVSSKRLSEHALREGLERARQQKRSLGRVLVSLGSITKKVLAEAMREQTRAKMESTLNWKEGHFEWGSWKEPPGDADLVLTKGIGIIARYAKNRFDTLGVSELEALFGKAMNRVIVPSSELETLAESAGPAIGLQQKELRFFQVSVDDRTIADAVTGSPLGRLASLRLIAIALTLGMLVSRDGRIHSNATQSRSRSEVVSPAVLQLKRDLRQQLSMFRDANYFEVLGVHWSAHWRNYRAAAEKLKADLNLGRAPLRDAPQEVQDMAKEVLKIVEKAYSTLSDEKLRVSYRNQFFDKTERQYSADMLVKQGEVALMRGDRPTAIELLETAVELDPSNRNRGLLSAAREGKS